MKELTLIVRYRWESWVLLLTYASYVTLCALYARITRRCCPKFTHEMEDIDISEMARTSSSWSSQLDDPFSPRLSMAADRNRLSVVGRTQESFEAVKAPDSVSASHRLGRSRIVMQVEKPIECPVLAIAVPALSYQLSWLVAVCLSILPGSETCWPGGW